MRRKKLEEYPNPSPTTLFKRDRTAEAAEEVCDHNIGATLAICGMLLKSWVNDKTALTQLQVFLPGSKTRLTYNSKSKIVTIEDHPRPQIFNKAVDDKRTNVPSLTDPRVTQHIFALLEDTLDGKLCDFVPSLKFAHTEYRLEELHPLLDRALTDEIFRLGIKDINQAASMLHKVDIYAMTVTGQCDIEKLIQALEMAFQKHKGKMIPLEKDAGKKLRHTL